MEKNKNFKRIPYKTINPNGFRRSHVAYYFKKFNCANKQTNCHNKRKAQKQLELRDHDIKDYTTHFLH